MKRRVILLLILAVVIAGGWIYWDSTEERRNANRIIAGIEDYRETQGRLPDSRNHELMKRLGFDLRVGWHPDYQARENGLYQITILEGFDGPYWTYNSSSKKWRKEFRPVEPSIANNQDAEHDSGLKGLQP